MTKPQNIREELLILVASLYYVENLGQAKVAQLAGISQANVSRLLTEARKRGIVQISVRPFSPRNADLETSLKKQFGLKNVIVINSTSQRNIIQQRQALGYFAAPEISKLIRSNDTVCVAAGRHIQNLVDNMKPVHSISSVTFVQAMGHIVSDIHGDDAYEITRRLAKTWGGTSLSIQAPAITESIEIFNAFTSHNQIKSVLNRMSDVDLAIIGIGTPSDSVFLDHEFLAPAEMDSLSDQGVIGEICGHFFNDDGHEASTSYKRRVISISLEQLRKAKNVIAVTSGADRAQAIRAAIRGGIINSLVVDDKCAAALQPLID